MDQERHTVRLYTRNQALARRVRAWFSGTNVDLDIVNPEKWPAPGQERGEFVLSSAALSSRLEMFAARIGGQVAVIPEAADYVIGKARAGGGLRPLRARTRRPLLTPGERTPAMHHYIYGRPVAGPSRADTSLQQDLRDAARDAHGHNHHLQPPRERFDNRDDDDQFDDLDGSYL